MVEIKVYPNKLDRDQFELCQAQPGQTLEQWLFEAVPAYERRPDPLFTARINGASLPASEWGSRVLRAGDRLELTVEAFEPMTIVLAVVAVVAAGAAIYAATQIPDNYAQTTPDGSPIYDVNAQGNRPRLMGVIPEIAGRHKVFPDYLCRPHRYYQDNEQWLNLMLAVGVGLYKIDPNEITIGNTPVTQYSSDISYEIFPPGADVTGHPAHRNIYTSKEVGGTSGTSGLEVAAKIERVREASSSRVRFTTKTMTRYRASRRYWGKNDEEGELVYSKTNWPRDWSVGLHIVVTGAEIILAGWQNNLTVVDSGEDNSDPLNPVQLPDKLTASWGLDQFTPGSTIRLSGLGSSNDGLYVVATSSATELTLQTLDGDPVVGLAPMNVNASILKVASNDGTYRITAVNGEYMTLQKVHSETLEDDPEWAGFAVNTDLHSIDVALHADDLVGSWIGPFVACPPNTKASRLELDFRLSQGLGYLDDDGDFNPISVDVEIQWREFGSGSDWQSVVHRFTGATPDQLAETVEIDLSGMARPEVQVRRLTTTEDSTRRYDLVEWSALKAELPAATSYPDVTTIAFKIRGTNALSSQAENKLGVLAERILPVYENGAWSEPRPTQDIAPFFAHVIKDLGHGDGQIGLEELERLHQIWHARGDTFSAVFDEPSTIFEVLKRVLAAGFAEPTLDYGQIIPVRDEKRSAFDYQYQPDNMLGPLQWDVKMIDDDEPDGVEVEYFSSETWKSETVLCLLPEDLGANPEKVRAFGVTDRTRAWRYGMRRRRTARYRRTAYSFQTEMDGLNSRYLSYDALADDVPGYSQTGRVESVSGLTVRVNNPLQWGEGVHHMALRRPDGTLSGPYVVTPGDDAYSVLLPSGLDFQPVTDGSMEPPYYMFGEAESWCYPALITDIQPQGTERVSLKAVNYDDRVYADDDGFPPED